MLCSHDTASRESVKAFRSKSTVQERPSASQQIASGGTQSSSSNNVVSLPMQQQPVSPPIPRRRGRTRKRPIDPAAAMQALQPSADPLIGAGIIASDAALPSSSIVNSPDSTAQQRKGGVKELDWLWINGDLPKVPVALSSYLPALSARVHNSN